jgi:hypothetical protein
MRGQQQHGDRRPVPGALKLSTTTQQQSSITCICKCIARICASAQSVDIF